MDRIRKASQSLGGDKPSAGNDGKYFQTTKKGEIHEFKEELMMQGKDKKKEAVKKVIAAMTVGKDVSMLFTDVLNCIQTPDIELKKLVYLYLINYAKSQPDLAILAVNTFQKDSQDPNPLIRALAVRTMGCIRVERIIDYLCDPLRKTLRDEDPYVRKTAAICVAKLFDISPELAEDQGFLDLLTQQLSDSNPMVVANAVAALSEIQESIEHEVFELNASTLQKLLAALNECTEWGQVFILDCLATYTPSDAREAESVIERVTPRLSHANAAVVLSAIKVVMKYLDLLASNSDTGRTLLKKLSPPLVTLLSAEPEIQYVALRNINLIVQKKPTVLAQDTKVFFCKYNDPVYVKMEKLEIMIKLANDRNIDPMLLEFKEYATEVDVDFVRKSVRAIGRCAIKLKSAAERCINVLLELIETKVNYVVQEAIVVIKDIFRKYPNRYESIIEALCANLDTLDEPEAKASMIWIIGEYAERIANADELLETFLEGFHDENSQVQLSLLTSTVKLFLKKPGETQEMVQRVLTLATEESDNPDLRDRGYVYWRLLSTDPEAAKAVVLSEKPVITDDTSNLEPAALDMLINNISTLASIYHKPPESFVSKVRVAVQNIGPGIIQEEEEVVASSTEGQMGGAPAPAPSGGVVDLLGMDDMGSAPAPTPAPVAANPMADIMGGGAPAAAPAMGGMDTGMDFFNAPAAKPVSRKVYLNPNDHKGLQLSGCILRKDGKVTFDFLFENKSQQPMGDFAVQFNKNSWAIAPAAPLAVPTPLLPSQSAEVKLVCVTNGPLSPGPPNMMVQVAVKNNVDVFYFEETVPLEALFVEDGKLERDDFLQKWKSIPDEQEHSKQITGIPSDNPDLVQQKFGSYNVFFIARRQVGEQDILYMSLKTSNNIVILLELTFVPGSGSVKCCCKTPVAQVVPFFEETVERLLKL
eukprot:GFYU01005549.1.p1 GENE.GFYU01005549.1~~GFYU01005549.1.p1  ORF type:complete len:929 (+),score=345.40 GFYU01005549.1:52-2838(+)